MPHIDLRLMLFFLWFHNSVLGFFKLFLWFVFCILSCKNVFRKSCLCRVLTVVDIV